MILDQSLAIVRARRIEVNPKDYLGKETAQPPANAKYIEAPRLLVDDVTSTPVAAFGRILQHEFAMPELDKLKIQKGARLADLRRQVIKRTGCDPKRWGDYCSTADRHAVQIQNASFGYIPSRPIFGHMAGPCHFNETHKDFYLKKLTPAAFDLERVYEKCFPETYAMHTERAKEIQDIYRIGRRSVYTQGVINRSVGFKYHYDKGNFDGVKSAMMVFGNFTGGFLHLPEYEVYVRIVPNTYFIFDGQNLIHGVTRIEGQRYSIVYFTIERQTTCGTREEEIEKWQKTQKDKANKALQRK